MSVRIERLSLRDFGPLRDLVLVPADLTVVFGQNEAGKTSCIDALARAMRDRVRPGSGKLLEQLREGPGFQGDIDLVLSPEDGGAVLELLSDYPSLARLFIVRDADASLEGGRGWLNAIRGRLIGIDLQRVSDKVRKAASLTNNSSPREARVDERQRLAERLTRLDGFLADLPAISRSLEECLQIERQRVATRGRIERLRDAERYERYRLAQRSNERAQESRRELQDLERYGDQDLTDWREAVSAVREAAAIAKSAENDTQRLRDSQDLSSEELKKREIAAEKADAQRAECTRRDLEGIVSRARLSQSTAQRWSLWRTPLAVAGILLLVFAIGAGLQVLAPGSASEGGQLGLLSGAAAVLGLLGAGLSIYATSNLRRAANSQTQALAVCATILSRADNLETCAAQISELAGNSERADAEKIAAAEKHRALEESIQNAEAIEQDRRRTLEGAQRMVADVRERVRLSSIEQLEEKLRERTRISSTLEEAQRTAQGVLGERDQELAIDKRIEKLALPDPGVSPNPIELAQLELELEAFDSQLLRLRGEVTDRRDRTLTAVGLSNLATAKAERDRLAEGIKVIDDETRAGKLCLQVLRELDQDIDRPLREALGNGPGAAGAYLARFTSGRYVSVVIDEDGKLAVERDDGTRFSMDALSRGARDQLALSVRVALVRRLLGEPGFLALDDAFLSSDAGRRQSLVSAFTSLTEEGWQIVYFTFDSDLRDQLAAKGAKVLELPTPQRSAS